MDNRACNAKPNNETDVDECPNCGRSLMECYGNCIFGKDSWKELSLSRCEQPDTVKASTKKI